MRILYVEDDLRDADLATRLLLRAAPHFRLETVSTAGAASARLGRLDTEPLDLVLTDVRLPDGDGLALLTQIRDRGLPLAVVVITGTGDEETAVAALKAGADDYITKRSDYLDRLPLTLEGALHHHRARAVGRSRSLRVLYAEHDPKDVDFTRRHFAKHAGHFQLDVVATGPEALRRLREAGAGGGYDVLLLDYRLPGLDALELLKELRLVQKLDIPVVVVTGQGSEEIALHAIKLGAASYVVKNPGYLYQLPGELENAVSRAELVRREEALRESEERNRAILQAIPDLMFLQSRDGVYLDYHAQDAGHLYAPPEQFLGKKVRDVLPPELADVFHDCFERALATGETQVQEYSLPMPGGARWYEARIAPCNGDKLLSIVRDITERKRDEAALEENENQLRLFVEHTPVAVAMFDREMRYLLTSRRWLKDNNLGEQDIIGRSHYEVVPDIPEHWRAGHRRCLAGAVERREEDIFPHPDGTFDWVRWEIRPWYAAGGEVGGIIMSSEMITERKQAEEALRFQAHLLNTIEQAVIATDMSGVVIFWNQFAETLYGWSMDEAMGREVKDLLRYEGADEQAEEVWSQLRKGQSWAGEFTLKNRDGDVLQLWVSDSPIHDERGNVVGVLGISYDITERRRAEDALRESEERFRMMADAAPMMIWMSGTDRLCTYFNKSWLDFVGRTLEEEIGDGWCEGVHPDDCDRCLEIYNESFDARLPFTMEYRLRRHDGEYRWVLDTGAPHYSPGGAFLGYIGSCLDITERKRAEEELMRLTVRLFTLQDEERRRIARELHDGTAQNLFALTFNLSRLQQHDAARDAELQRIITDTVALGEESLREIRTLSYLLHPPLLDQAGLVSALRWYVKGFIKRSGIYVDLISLQQIGRLPSEVETALFRIVQESLTNIHRHSGGTTAAVRLEKKKNGEIVLQVKDNGRGMPALESLEPPEEVLSLGVGIPGMRQRMRQLGGRLEVVSGEAGTTVTATIPFEEGAECDSNPAG